MIPKVKTIQYNGKTITIPDMKTIQHNGRDVFVPTELSKEQVADYEDVLAVYNETKDVEKLLIDINFLMYEENPLAWALVFNEAEKRKTQSRGKINLEGSVYHE